VRRSGVVVAVLFVAMHPCRTIEVAGSTFETIPEKLFIKAALVAAAQLLDLTPEAPPSRKSCGALATH
jgi:hypothetical protein